MTSYKLYYREGSGSMVIEAALAMAGAAYDLIAVPDKKQQRSEAFLKRNPAGKIPVLVLPDGTPIAETMAILLVLDEAFPKAGLLPPLGSPGRPKALQWLAFMASSTYPAAIRFYYAHRHTTQTEDAAHEAVRLAASATLDEDFAAIMAALKDPFFAGESMSILDVYAAMLADWHGPAMKDGRMQRLKAGILENPAVHIAWLSHEYPL